MPIKPIKNYFQRGQLTTLRRAYVRADVTDRMGGELPRLYATASGYVEAIGEKTRFTTCPSGPRTRSWLKGSPSFPANRPETTMAPSERTIAYSSRQANLGT